MSAGQAKDAGTPTSRRVLAKVYYNTVFAKYVCGGSKNPYPLLNQDTAGKEKLNGSFDTVKAEIEDRQIPAFPQGAVAVKTAWWLVKAKGPPTALPVWDPNSNSTQPGGNSPLGVAEQEPGRWARWVAVNPDLSASGESETVTKVGRVAYATRVVPIRRFFYVQLTKNQAAQVTKVLEGETITATPGAKAEAGDFLILVGLHFTTKEIPNWVWATFWWHDRPDEGPYAEQRPSMVLRRWRNYLMNVSYSMNDPREPQGSPHICFNPYLEAITPTFLASTVSNCMTCHRQAVWKGGPDFSRASGEISVADKSFAGKLRLDFIWSLSVHNDSACAAVP
jgi:hypothetical protein